MALTDQIPEGSSGRFPHQGLLSLLGQWTLPSGASQVPPLQWAARSLILLSALVLLAWLLAVLADARSSQIAWHSAVLAVGAALAWTTMARRLWLRLRGTPLTGGVTLVWGGLPPLRPDPSVHQRQTHAPLPGWSVAQWAQPVTVRVVFDLGPWVLIKVESKAGVDQPRRAWSWASASLTLGGESGHRLRALLFSPAANDVDPVVSQDSRADVTAEVASWARTQRLWSKLLPASHSPDSTVKPNLIRRGASRRATLGEPGFAATQLLDPRDSLPSDAPRSAQQEWRSRE
ncbi:MAG: hypothetical protein KGL90_04405 [Burkholderiales bacterium]|nr:hypothetical protein [Burkholderiales bacterium]